MSLRRKVSDSPSAMSSASNESFVSSSNSSGWFRKSSTLAAFGSRRSSKKDQPDNIVSAELYTCYKKTLKKFEGECLFHVFNSPPLEEAEFEAKPVIMLLGQYSTGKTTFIRHLLGEDFPGIRIGPEPTTDCFNVIMKGAQASVIPGNAVTVDPRYQFRALKMFGGGFLNRLQCSIMDADILENITLIDTPGILAGEKQCLHRGYDYNGVVKWFAQRVDRILVLFDAHKLDISDEMRNALGALSGHSEKIRVVLNKSDMVSPQQLMRVYGSLMWSLGKVLPNPESVRVYLGSFWDQPLVHETYRELFNMEHTDLFEDLNGLPRFAALRLINDFIKRARDARIQALIISELAKRMPSVFRKDKRKKELIDNLDFIFQAIQDVHGISPSDFPEIEPFKAKLERVDWSTFRQIERSQFDRLQKMINEDMAKVMQTIPCHGTQIIKNNKPPPSSSNLNGPLSDLTSAKTPFRKDDSLEENYNWDLKHRSEGGWPVEKHVCYSLWRKEFEDLSPFEGNISGALAKSELTKSKLPNVVLSKIWIMSDVNKDGMLNSDEFCLAKFLLEEKLQGRDLPKELPDFLLPPIPSDEEEASSISH
ncbi:hypothetical protein TCAL_05737 [Tigriopus californicus]|uniref:Uncharacterized protein n=1 Tax=Tigriopus californicus TaxID=6832 RepID=A0A553N7W2_TIGCA|nr:EH domain-containing protein 1-like [Tigriopus californicus]TRY61532.1 hypothetical protein TCAL_05737 [Tigriopus californicus]|eukprot:TCALIF_05737-PA protein Name:"Similar to EHD1 EH domain-containing protein 1 (Pongo abelii)" AED:0.22 eAED:0.22 QI:90/1/1/1/0.83/0.85/7/76/592